MRKYRASGEEIGQIGDGLGELLEFLRPDLVDHQREDDRRGEVTDQHFQVQHDRVLHHVPEVGVGDELLELFEPHPLAAPDALDRVVLLKGDDEPHHGSVLENYKVEHRKQQQQVQVTAFIDTLADLSRTGLRISQYRWAHFSSSLLRAISSRYSSLLMNNVLYC